MKKPILRRLIVTTMIMAMGLLAACGPLPEVPQGDSADSATGNTAVTERVPGLAGGSNVAREETQAIPAPEVNSNPDQITQTSDGLTVGFTAEGRPFIGNPDAEIVIEEFSDYQCPFCSRFVGETWPTIKKTHIETGEVMVIFYDFPLAFHEQAVPAAHAARCAGEGGANAYWGMHDLLFSNLQAWGSPNYLLTMRSYAAELGLDVDDFGECMTSGRYNEAIQGDEALGRERGVTGTPSFFINGELLVGAVPTAAFSNAIAKVQAGESLAQLPDPAQGIDPATVDMSDVPPFEMPTPIETTPSTVPVLGDEDAPITIVEFSDYQCPFCRRHVAETMPTLLAEMIETGRVRYEFKDFPLESIHPEAGKASEAARCAAEQGAYWEMHDSIFENQQLWSGQANHTAVFTQLADQLGLETTSFDACLSSDKYAAAVQADLDEGIALGVTGTPTFFIGGYGISGAQPFDLFEMVVGAIETDSLEAVFREAYDAQVESLRAQRAAQGQQLPQAPQAPPPPSEPVDVPIEGWPTIGNPDAPITIVEYTDFQCPYCNRYFEQTFPLVKENYIDTGLVRYVFKDFPLSFHQQAPDAARAARCAHDQEAFMPMHDLLFERQGQWSGRSDVVEILAGYAAELGLDTAVFNDCVSSGKYNDAIQADLAEGFQVGVSGTPSFLVNGNLLVGALPFSTFQQAIESLLAQEQ